MTASEMSLEAVLPKARQYSSEAMRICQKHMTTIIVGRSVDPQFSYKNLADIIAEAEAKANPAGEAPSVYHTAVRRIARTAGVVE